ncbi:MAG: aspartate aminotransferase family protein [Ponticaulis sp.]|nr:aspartate aminotransferase family protein [Ponticaulis sp.]
MNSSITATSSNVETAQQALDRLHRDFTARNPKSFAQHEQACEVFPGGNTRTALHYPPFPLTMARGEGSRLWDLDGHEYINLLGEYTAGLYGHSHPVVGAAIRAALDDGISFGSINSVEAQFGRAVVDRFPSIEQVRFTNSGTEANLMAIGLARAFTKKNRILAFRGGYHGAVLTTGVPSSPLNAPFDIVYGRFNDIEATREVIEANADELAVIITEPMLGSGGCVAGDPEFLQLLRDKADETGAVLIFDEVMTSRLSPGGLQGKLGILPDLTTLGKYLGGGSSFGGFGGREEIMSLFDARKDGALMHAGTFNNNVITMVAGYTGLTQVFTPEVCIDLNARGDELRARLNKLCQSAGVDLQFTGVGSLMNAHVTTQPIQTIEDVMTGDMVVRDVLFHHLLQEGIYAARRGFVALTLVVTDEDLDAYVGAVQSFIERYEPILKA